jgi:hypothetical protein
MCVESKAKFATIKFAKDDNFLTSRQFTTNCHWPCWCTVHVYIFVMVRWNFCESFFLSNHQETVGSHCPIKLYHLFWSVSSQDLDFQSHILWSFNVEWREVRNDCWLYLHWWNYRPWLPKEEFEDTKGVIIIRKPTDRQHKYFIFIPKVLEHTSGIAYVICHDVNILGILAVYPFGVFKPFFLPPSFNTYHVLKQSKIANFNIFYTTTIGSELQSCLYI